MRSLPDLSVRNPVLVNLMMFTIIIGGLYAAFTLVREMFPETRPNQVMIMTPYPGASPAEIEKGISAKIEEQIKDIEGVEEIRTTITEGLSTIAAVLFNEVKDVDRVVTDIKNAIDAIPRSDFPQEAEETVVSRFEPKLPVISVSLYGDLTDRQLKTLGKRMRDDILALPGITDVVLSGTRRDEISVEVRPEQLLRYDLSFLEIGEAIRAGNLDLPGGQVKTDSANVAVRTLGEKDKGVDLEELVIRADRQGEILRLSDVAEVIDGFEDTDLTSRMDGKPGVSVIVYKTVDQDAIDISQRVKALVAGKNGGPLEIDWLARLTGQDRVLLDIYERAASTPYPAIGTLKTHSNLARFIEGRLDLLRRNGLWGLIFVFVSLLFFLNLRVAFWVMMGLLLAILGTLMFMQVAGITLNLMTMFGLIVVLGMLVDDAIIVGEHIYTKIEEGVEPDLAAVQGAEEVTNPVICAIATTMVAFAPLLFIKGTIGEFMGVLPMIVIIALSISLFEALTILPCHLAESFRKRARNREFARQHRPRPSWTAPIGNLAHRLRVAVVDNILRVYYARLLRVAVSYRYVSVAVAVAALILVFGLIGGGIVEQVFIQTMDAETLVATVELPVGSPLSRTDAAMRVIESVTGQVPEIETRFSLIGVEMDMQGGSGESHANVAQMIMELSPAEERDRASNDILRELREKTGSIPGVNSLTYRAIHGGPGGAAIHVEISGENLSDLVTVTGRFKQKLSEFAGVYDIDDDFDAGQREVQIELLASGRALGLTTESLASQVRAAFYGFEARKIQRDREDVKIMVRYPEAHRSRLFDLQQMRIRTADGALVPISEVARISEGSGYATIRRKDQRRTVTVKADVDQAVANSEAVLAALEPEFARLRNQFPGIDFEMGGQARERMKSFGSLGKDAMAAVILIYVVLAALFRSYIQPLIVMMAIPFGVIGAVVGHWVMGYPMTVLSAIGLVALTGIVVNDSLILVDFINRRVREGAGITESVVQGGMARLRAIMLTSVTTILGLSPLMLEQSFQAKFLIPMAISIAFGLAFATVLTLLLVPCLYVIVDDARRMGIGAFRVVWTGRARTAVD